MALFVRSADHFPLKKNYREYRPQVREDFLRRCHYCLAAEPIVVEGNFVIDHFKPQKEFRGHISAHAFLNLYYACFACNKTKLEKWPSAALRACEIGFVDLCTHNFEQHFRLRRDGVLEALTKSASYTIDMIRLNRCTYIQHRRFCMRKGFGSLPLWQADCNPTLRFARSIFWIVYDRVTELQRGHRG